MVKYYKKIIRYCIILISLKTVAEPTLFHGNSSCGTIVYIEWFRNYFFNISSTVYIRRNVMHIEIYL